MLRLVFVDSTWGCHGGVVVGVLCEQQVLTCWLTGALLCGVYFLMFSLCVGSLWVLQLQKSKDTRSGQLVILYWLC